MTVGVLLGASQIAKSMCSAYLSIGMVPLSPCFVSLINWEIGSINAAFHWFCTSDHARNAALRTEGQQKSPSISQIEHVPPIDLYGTIGAFFEKHWKAPWVIGGLLWVWGTISELSTFVQPSPIFKWSELMQDIQQPDRENERHVFCVSADHHLITKWTLHQHAGNSLSSTVTSHYNAAC